MALGFLKHIGKGIIGGVRGVISGVTGGGGGGKQQIVIRTEPAAAAPLPPTAGEPGRSGLLKNPVVLIGGLVLAVVLVILLVRK